MPMQLAFPATGYTVVQKFGRTSDMDQGDSNEDIWDGTGAYAFPSEAVAMTISSASANDTSAGTGARTVRVVGLDTNWDEIEQDLTMNGQTGVSIPTNLQRVYRAYVLTAGSGEVNAGDVWIGTGSITAGVPATKYAGIVANNGQSLMAIYTIPDSDSDGTVAGGRLLRWYGTVSAVQSARSTLALQTRESGQGWRTRSVRGVSEGSGFTDEMAAGIEIGTRTDIRIRALDCGVNNTAIEAGFDLALKR